MKIWRVRVSGETLEMAHELCSRERTPLWSIDGAEIILAFARTCARQATWCYPFPLPERVAAFLSGDLTAVGTAFETWPAPREIYEDWLAYPEAMIGVTAERLRGLKPVAGSLAAAQVAVYSALAAHVAFNTEGSDAEMIVRREFIALRWAALAYIACLFVAAFSAENYTEAWQRKLSALNEALEADVWQRALDAGLCTPGSERDWHLAQLK